MSRRNTVRCTLDVIMSAPDAALWFTNLRGPHGPKVTRATVYGWAARYKLTKYDGGWRYGDLLQADARARTAIAQTRRVA
jgi:hypothetical protein